MRDRIILGPELAGLQAQWRRRVEPGGSDHLQYVLRDHLDALAEWRDRALDLGFGEPFRQRELAGRLRILADVHKQLADFLEDAADVRDTGVPCSWMSGAVEKGFSTDIAAETDKDLDKDLN